MRVADARRLTFPRGSHRQARHPEGVVKLVKAGSAALRGYAPSDPDKSLVPTVICAGSQNSVASDAVNTGSTGSSYVKASGGPGEPGVVSSSGNDTATSAAVPSSSVPSRLDQSSADDALVGEASPTHQGHRSFYTSGAWQLQTRSPRGAFVKGEVIEDADRMTVSDSVTPAWNGFGQQPKAPVNCWQRASQENVTSKCI